ncbi:hypothetical protein HNV11_14285 [Spirosoma taeanense]|uniref:Uncharacterized protein n=1 Tax=Spirosoma taeanense TaxID=2735870 RepID=A0A6M5YB50_9BACT|nr:hypothetical protein [Spirosoma taeanense]QJW90463.1 hypothetical protein HNV11_14285 [Spirosoma taeanense]
MNGNAEKIDTLIPITRRNGHKPVAPPAKEPEAASFRELSSALRLTKTAMGVFLFLSWLVLFIMGMSLSANRYSPFLTDASGSVNWANLLTYGLLFTPTNGAILASLAGVLGGIASNLAADNKFRHIPPTSANTTSDDFQSYLYMTENPLVSMLRGFLTYLIFIAGSYLTNFTTSSDSAHPEQFLGLTAPAYFKFAVSISLLAYLAGYDPSRMKSLINSFSLTRKEPEPSGQSSVSAHIIQEKTKIDAKVTQDSPAIGRK